MSDYNDDPYQKRIEIPVGEVDFDDYREAIANVLLAVCHKLGRIPREVTPYLNEWDNSEFITRHSDPKAGWNIPGVLEGSSDLENSLVSDHELYDPAGYGTFVNAPWVDPQYVQWDNLIRGDHPDLRLVKFCKYHWCNPAGVSMFSGIYIEAVPDSQENELFYRDFLGCIEEELQKQEFAYQVK